MVFYSFFFSVKFVTHKFDLFGSLTFDCFSYRSHLLKEWQITLSNYESPDGAKNVNESGKKIDLLTLVFLNLSGFVE